MAIISSRQKLINEVKLALGDGIITLELDQNHYDYALDKAFYRYRQRSTNSVEECFVFLDIQPDVSTYTLPNEIQTVRSVLRRTMTGTAGGTAIDPFALAFTNNIYMIQNPGGLGGSGSGTLATYDLAMGFQNLAGRMFGRDVMFTWNPSSHKLLLHRDLTGQEQVALHCDSAKPEDMILTDVFAKPWVLDYTIAVCKTILGGARSKFSSIAGPQGGITLNGDKLSEEGNAAMERLETELVAFVDSSMGMPLLVG